MVATADRDIPIITKVNSVVTGIVTGSLAEAAADDIVERQASVGGRRRGPELHAALPQLVQLPAQQQVLQLHLRTRPDLNNNNTSILH